MPAGSLGTVRAVSGPCSAEGSSLLAGMSEIAHLLSSWCTSSQASWVPRMLKSAAASSGCFSVRNTLLAVSTGRKIVLTRSSRNARAAHATEAGDEHAQESRLKHTCALAVISGIGLAVLRYSLLAYAAHITEAVVGRTQLFWCQGVEKYIIL